MEEDPVLRQVQQFQAGIAREENFRKLYQRFHQPIRLFFLRKGFTEDESRDLTQDVFYRLYGTLPNFRGHSSFEVWLFSLVTHVYHNELRRRFSLKREGVEVSLDADRGPEYQGTELSSADEGPLELAIRKEQRLALQSALENLPEQMRMCCILRYERGLKYQEIAVVMGISIQTVKAHLHQARQRLAAMLGDGKEGFSKAGEPS